MKTNTTLNKLSITLFVVALLLPVFLISQTKPEINHSKEIITDQVAPSEVRGNQRVELGTGIARAVYNPKFKVNNDEPKIMAQQYLKANLSILTQKADINDLEHQRTIETPGGYKVHFTQKAAGYPVYGATINVSINRKDEVVFVTNDYKPLGNLQTTINTSPEAAILASKNHIGILGKLSFKKVKTVVYNINFSKSVIAYKVNLVPAENHFGDWELIIDASNGTILRAEDKACYYHPDTDSVTGSAWVFDPDPINNARATYGVNGFIDNDDADSDSLTAQLIEVELENITYEDADEVYSLIGPYAAIVDWEAPFKGLFKQSDNLFHYTRSADNFEAANCYYHIHKSMKYLNEDLGFDIMPHQYSGGVQFDPSGFGGADNSHYNETTGQIAFGEGGVDDGEGVEVILHELGHGLHDWITAGGLSQVDGLSEGIGDYWAASYIRSLGKWEPEEEEYNWVFHWIGHSEFWQGRIINHPGHYPEDMNNLIHHNGQLWSSSLMQIWDLIGGEETDINLWEAVSMLNSSSSQVDAAFAFIQADYSIYNGVHSPEIYEVFHERGYMPTSLIPSFTANNTNGEGPREVTFSDESINMAGQIESWAWDFNNDGVIDSYVQNPTHMYTEVGAYTVSLTISDGERQETQLKQNYITVNGGFFVWETDENQRNYSGTFIRDFLEERGYDVIYSNYYPSTLKGFDGVFLSFGNAGWNFEMENLVQYDHTLVIQDYLEEGGKIFTEGSPFFSATEYFNYPNSEVVHSLFGIDSAELIPSANPISKLSGIDETIHKGLVFNSSKQQTNWHIDKLQPMGNAKTSFLEEDYGYVSIYNDGEFGQKTFHFNYALAELSDTDPKSSRYNFLLKVMEFFGYSEGEGYVVANFEADKTNVESGMEVNFTDWSIVDDGYEITGWAWDFNEDGVIDSYDQNPKWSFTQGGQYDITLIVSCDTDIDTLTRADLILVRSGILVYEGIENVNGFSGTFIREYLQDHWYDEVYYTNTFPSTLSGYDAVFLSFGNGGYYYTSVTNQMAVIIYNYCLAGGKVYVEGGDMMSSANILWQVFGLSDVGEGEENSITSLMGQTGSIADGLHFTNSSQYAFERIDVFEANDDFPGVEVAFVESDYGPVAVQFDGVEMLGQKTFCMSYALADLEDGTGSNTKNELLSRVLNFFDVVSDVNENELSIENNLKVFPNPAHSQVTLQLNVVESGNIQVELFDLSGRRISTINKNVSQGPHNIDFNISGFNTGIYYFRLQSGNQTETIKWVKVE